MDNNKLNGPIPPSIFNITSLEIISLMNNGFSGSLPIGMCTHNLHALIGIYLDYNMFIGRIPPSLSQCSQLEELWLDSNNFTEDLPREIGNITKLQTLYIFNNSISGMKHSFYQFISTLHLLLPKSTY